LNFNPKSCLVRCLEKVLYLSVRVTRPVAHQHFSQTVTLRPLSPDQ
jgi:hypothetical protein